MSGQPGAILQVPLRKGDNEYKKVLLNLISDAWAATPSMVSTYSVGLFLFYGYEQGKTA